VYSTPRRECGGSLGSVKQEVVVRKLSLNLGKRHFIGIVP